jgi:prepilin peptidase CpaA
MSGGIEIVLWVLLGVAFVTDLLWGKIYNAVTFPFLLLGLAIRFGMGGWTTGVQSLLAVGTAFAVFFPLYLLKALAAGDVKLLMAFGAWCQPSAVVQVAISAILIGAMVGAYLLIRQKGLRQSTHSLAEHVRSFQPRSSMRMPFAPSLLCAFFIVRIAELRQWHLI